MLAQLTIDLRLTPIPLSETIRILGISGTDYVSACIEGSIERSVVLDNWGNHSFHSCMDLVRFSVEREIRFLHPRLPEFRQAANDISDEFCVLLDIGLIPPCKAPEEVASLLKQQLDDPDAEMSCPWTHQSTLTRVVEVVLTVIRVADQYARVKAVGGNPTPN